MSQSNDAMSWVTSESDSEIKTESEPETPIPVEQVTVSEELDFEEEVEKKSRGFLWFLGVLTALTLIGFIVVGWYWSREPEQFDVTAEALKRAGVTNPDQLKSGYIYSNTLAHIAETLLYKPGGYLTNDVSPPSILMDNMASWEFGALIMLRDATSVLRNHFARSQSQSRENPDLAKTEPYFYFENNSWAIPSTEGEYEKGIDRLHKYMRDLNTGDRRKAGFHARADNLSQYLQVVEKRLGSFSQRLSSSSGHERKFDLKQRKNAMAKTPWLEVDNVFYETRGAAWALVQILKSVEIEFDGVLRGKNAKTTVRQIIHNLEDSLSPTLSPVVLNGSGFGMFANYSLTMANYIARANAGMLDLRDLMMRG